MNQRIRFAWAFLRRHKKLVTAGMDERFYADMVKLCNLELAQLVTDPTDNRHYFILRCASDAMFK